MSKLDPKRVREAFSAARAQRDQFSGGGGGGRFISLSGGYNLIRLFPDANGHPFMYMRTQRVGGGEGGRLETFLDLKFVLENEAAKELLDEFVSPNDRLLTNQFGDPFTALYYRINAGTAFGEQAQEGWLLPNNRMLYAAARMADDGSWEYGVLERGPEFHEQIEVFVVGEEIPKDDGTMKVIEPTLPNLFDEEAGPALDITGNGKKGLQRRYKPLKPAADGEGSGPLEVPDRERPDFEALLRRNFKGWHQKYQILQKRFGDELLSAQGMGTDDVKAAADVGF